MKNLFIFFFISAFCLGFSQNLKLAELLHLRTADLDETEEYLTKKGWDYIGLDAIPNSQLGSLNFEYRKEGTKFENLASIVKFISSEPFSKILLQIHKHSKYLEYINEIKLLKAKLIYSGLEDGRLVKVYQNDKITFRFSTITISRLKGEEGNSYILTIMNNEDYF